MKKLQSLRVKMPLIIISMVTFFIVALIIITEIKASDAIKNATYTGYNNTVMGYAFLIDTWFDDQLAIASIYGTSEELIRFLQLRTEDLRNIALNNLKKFKSLNEYAINIGLSDSSGNILIDSDNPDLVNQNVFNIHPDLKDKVNGNSKGVFGENITHSLTTGGWSLILLEKVTDNNNQLIGYLHVMLDWSTLNKNHIEPLVIGKTGSMYAVDKDLIIKIHSQTANINGTAPPQFKDAFNIGKGILTYVFNNEKRVSSVITLKSQPWVLGISVTEAEIYEANRMLILMMIIISLIAIVIISVFISMFIMSITKPLHLLVGVAKEIAEGDLRTTKQKIKRKDELGELSDAFVAMRKKLVDTIVTVEESANNITMAAKELSEQNTDLAHRTESQAASIEQTSASMTEISSTIRDSAEHSINGSKMILDSKSSVENAGNIISETTTNIEEVHDASSKIKDITKIIEDIAFQTNILALNASVEAARAGEQGKGFAVVAAEVRNLAQTTQTSVKSITDLIENVYDKIDKATGTARESQEIFIEIQNKIDDASKIMEGISNSAIEQQNGIDQVKVAIAEMDSTTQKNAALVEEATASAELLFAQSKELMDAIHLFKLPDGTK
ncbi:methyl-accepting chemotaxis protein [Brachyspira hyodysenteriae]|uniref:methyl-accepting chemotaxis protein n=1 Tax=Brachyspira hyodysenteriae TaxID=159 RepID=UPI0022CD9386|nr:methyl-accepting chemotaxis protein [Brachyspira hyodysenteriae]MCZ9935763.1 methyl-accepting chemotaxis protein [Brachyspira hyodysenteriae]MCZ9967007.1 methyl-accepting chemotaxis protein [Brachyspira hyodysenteriae]MCZ9991066.1 methyl-accepting chemotaxis protein [Brachyspira hyodysenteriae]MDA0015138.1 methyl-accepting chemotaxis protein [Brachyspira hyodysenteriae]MDA0069086.1 methyl-accepting chemotaxis protein [Brachyspira hyodysenteriae]